MTPMSPSAYRVPVDAHPDAIQNQMAMRQAFIDNGGVLPSPAQRDFSSILTYMQSVLLTSSSYFIVAGVASAAGDEGAIVARDMNASTAVQQTLRLGQSTTWVPFDWALIQTNYDWWAPLPYPHWDNRRDVLVAHFSAEGRESVTTYDGLLGSLSVQSATNETNGVLNVATVFSVLIVPENSTRRSYVRNSTGCCA